MSMDVLPVWKWLPSGMMEARYACASASIDGRVYVFGGYHRGKSDLRAVEVWDDKNKKWESLPPMPTKRYGCAAVAHGREIFVVGGRTTHFTSLDTVEVYHVDHKTWTKLPSMQESRYCCDIVVLDNNDDNTLFVVGGKSKNHPNGRATAETMDLNKRNQWEMVPTDMKSVRAGCSAVVVNHRYVYVMGGYSSNVRTSLQRAKSNKQQKYRWWFDPLDLVYGMIGLLVSYGGTVGVSMGSTALSLLEQATSSYREAEIYDRVTKRWKRFHLPGAMAHTCRQQCCAVATSNPACFVLLGGASVHGHNFNTVSLYDANTREWKRMPRIVPKRDGYAVTNNDGDTLFVLGGQDRSRNEQDSAMTLQLSIQHSSQPPPNRRVLLSLLSNTLDFLSTVLPPLLSWIGVLFLLFFVAPLQSGLLKLVEMVKNIMYDKNHHHHADDYYEHKSLSTGDAKIPPELFCPITLELMKHPVVAVDGYTYERAAMQRVFSEANAIGADPISPVTGTALSSQTLVPNRAIQSQCLRQQKTAILQINN